MLIPDFREIMKLLDNKEEMTKINHQLKGKSGEERLNAFLDILLSLPQLELDNQSEEAIKNLRENGEAFEQLMNSFKPK